MKEPRLYIVPTPLGNLEDMTFRAVTVLKEADLVLAEDTRHSLKLLQHYGIKANLKSYHKFNEHQIGSIIIENIKKNSLHCALITDAGTPGISDPGYLIINKAIENGIEVECLPGATAFVPALVESGLPMSSFVFEGFLPAKKGRNKKLEQLKEESRTMIFYESPHRLLKTLKQFCQVFGDERRASVSKEISKIYHQTFRGTLAELTQLFEESTVKGEFVIIVHGKE